MSMSVQRGGGSVIAWVCLVLFAAAAAAAEPERALRLNIAAQPVGEALNEFAQQSGLQVVIDPQESKGITVQEVVGVFTVRDALEKLLANTGLRFEYLNERTVAVRGVKTTAIGVEGGAEVLRDNTMRLAQTQSNSGAPADQVQSPQDASAVKSASVQEIVVTATKREESVSDVPMSIAVVTADDIDRRRLVGAADYLRGIPGVNQVDGGFTGQAIVIRGIETTTSWQNLTSGATTATYFGETPTTGSAGLLGSNVDIKLIDIERVEVLRGPQGTAFGNASMGGAVRTIPVAPKLDRFEGSFGAGYSATSGTGGENYMFRAVGNAPLIRDKFAIRATAYTSSDSGFYRNRASSDPAFQAVIAPFGAQALATDEEEIGAYYVAGARVAALFQASTDLRITLNYLTQKTELDGFAVQNSGTYEQTALRVAPEHVRRGQTAGLTDTDIDIANAVMEYNLGWADLLATYSYVKGGTTQALSWTAFNSPWPVSVIYLPVHRGHVGEIRLATNFNGAWNVLAGFYAEKNEDEYPIDFAWSGDPDTNIFVPGERSLGTILDRRDLKETAAFAEVEWELLPGLTLTGGVRANQYDRTIRVDTGSLFGGHDTSQQDNVGASNTSFRANLSYKPNDNTLLYVGWAQGFRLGRPQARAPESLCDEDGDGFIDGSNVTIESTGRIDSDAVDSYELGGKFALMDRRLTVDAALFRMEWSDIPVNVRFPSCSWVTQANAGAALSEGVEFQVNLQINDSWRVDFGGSWLNARLTKDIPAQGFSDGDRLPGSPKTNANLGLQYAFKIGGDNAFLRADSIYVGPFHSEVLQSPNNKAGDYVKLDAMMRVAIRNLNVDLYVHNLTDQDAFTFRSSSLSGVSHFGYRPRPRTVGLQLGYTF